MILRYLIVTQAVLLTVAVLVGCVAPTSPSPLPTPTTVEGSLLSIELIADGGVCVELESEYELLFANSEAVWNEAWSDLKDRISINPDMSGITELIEETDFQTQALLLVIRTCGTSGTYAIAIDRVVEGSANMLYVYVSLFEPSPEHGVDAMATGRYQIVRIPWSQEGSDPPQLTEVVYTRYLLLGEVVTD